MGQLQTKMVEDLQLRGCAPTTCKEYVRCARSFVAYRMRPPTQLGESDVRRFLLYLAQEREVGPATIKMHTAAIKLLCERTLDRPEVVARVPYIKVPQKLPKRLPRMPPGPHGHRHPALSPLRRRHPRPPSARPRYRGLGLAPGPRPSL
jgi:hypothetical protein